MLHRATKGTSRGRKRRVLLASIALVHVLSVEKRRIRIWNVIGTFIHTYHSRFIPKGVAEESQIFLRETQILPKLLNMRLTAGVTGGKPITV
jgi:hypothetical protein